MKTELRHCRYCGSIPICESKTVNDLDMDVVFIKWYIMCPKCNIVMRCCGKKKYSKEIRNRAIDSWNSDEAWEKRKKFDSREFLF